MDIKSIFKPTRIMRITCMPIFLPVLSLLAFWSKKSGGSTDDDWRFGNSVDVLTVAFCSLESIGLLLGSSTGASALILLTPDLPAALALRLFIACYLQ